MPIGLAIFFITSCIIAYLLIGVFSDMTIDLYWSYENPLWKLPIVVFWPLAMLCLVGHSIWEWIESVIEYYKNKED